MGPKPTAKATKSAVEPPLTCGICSPPIKLQTATWCVTTSQSPTLAQIFPRRVHLQIFSSDNTTPASDDWATSPTTSHKKTMQLTKKLHHAVLSLRSTTAHKSMSVVLHFPHRMSVERYQTASRSASWDHVCHHVPTLVMCTT